MHSFKDIELVDLPYSEHTCDSALQERWRSRWPNIKLFADRYELLLLDISDFSKHGCGICCEKIFKGILDSQPPSNRYSIAKKLLDYSKKDNLVKGMEPLTFSFTHLEHHIEWDKVDPTLFLAQKIEKYSNNDNQKSFKRSAKSTDKNIDKGIDNCLKELQQKGYICTSVLSTTFLNLFNNSIIKKPLVWEDNKVGTITYFIKQLRVKNVITPTGMWEAANNCFCDKDACSFDLTGKSNMNHVSSIDKRQLDRCVIYITNYLNL